MNQRVRQLNSLKITAITIRFSEVYSRVVRIKVVKIQIITKLLNHFLVLVNRVLLNEESLFDMVI